jgi:exodeoxyribonuclease VII small subunit
MAMEADPAQYEQALVQLEECVEALERGGLPLETALARFEAGIQLAAQCEAILEGAELRVTQLLANGDEPEPAF